MEVCRDVAEVVAAVERIIDREKNEHPEEGASFFFRGEVRNYVRPGSRDLNPAFSCLLDRERTPSLRRGASPERRLLSRRPDDG